MSRSSDSDGEKSPRKPPEEIIVPRTISENFSERHVKEDTDIPPSVVKVSSKLIDGKSQREVAEELNVSRTTLQRFVGRMRDAGVIDLVNKGSNANYYPKGPLNQELGEESTNQGNEQRDEGLESKFSFSDYPNGVGGEIVRSIDRANSKKRSAERLNRNLNAEREEIEAAMYKLHEVDILRTWKTEEWIFGELNEEFEEEFNFEPDELTEEHLGVFLDTLQGFSLSEIEERRDVDSPLEARRDLEYLMEETETEGASVEYEPTDTGAATLGLLYAHTSAGNDYPALEVSSTEDAVQSGENSYSVRGKKLWQQVRSNKVSGEVVDPEDLIKGSVNAIDEGRNSGNVQKLVDAVEEAGGFLEFDSLASELNISDYMMGRTIGEACTNREEVYMTENGVRYETGEENDTPGWSDFAN